MLCIFMETAAKTQVGPVEHRRLLGGPSLSPALQGLPSQTSSAPASARVSVSPPFHPRPAKNKKVCGKNFNSPHLTGGEITICHPIFWFFKTNKSLTQWDKVFFLKVIFPERSPGMAIWNLGQPDAPKESTGFSVLLLGQKSHPHVSFVQLIVL